MDMSIYLLIDEVMIEDKGEVRQRQMTSQTSLYLGEYEGDRKVLLNESGELSYQRAGMPMFLKLVKVEEDLYEMKVPEGVYSPREMPKVYFIRDNTKNISGIQFIYKERNYG